VFLRQQAGSGSNAYDLYLKVLVLNLGQDPNYVTEVLTVLSVPPDKCQGRISNYFITASFHTLSHSLFISIQSFYAI
jgi:hypothetical protein